MIARSDPVRVLVLLIAGAYSQPLNPSSLDKNNMRKSPFALICFGALLAASAPAQTPASTLGLIRDPALVATIADISSSQIRATDSVLVSFGTRHAMSDTLSNTRGIGAARRYLFAKLSGYSAAAVGAFASNTIRR